MKIKLPLVLTSAHHLLFTFLHVPGKAREQESVVGYSVLPILSNEILMAAKDNALPVILDTLPPGYLSPEVEEHIKVPVREGDVSVVNLRLAVTVPREQAAAVQVPSIARLLSVHTGTFLS